MTDNVVIGLIIEDAFENDMMAMTKKRRRMRVWR